LQGPRLGADASRGAAAVTLGGCVHLVVCSLRAEFQCSELLVGITGQMGVAGDLR